MIQHNSKIPMLLIHTWIPLLRHKLVIESEMQTQLSSVRLQKLVYDQFHH